jgi:hypothetical protein
MADTLYSRHPNTKKLFKESPHIETKIKTLNKSYNFGSKSN